MGQDRPKLGQFGIGLVQNVLPGFCEKRFLGKRKLTLAKYLGAYTTVASQGLLLGLRFRHTPLPVLKLVCDEGRESDLAGWLRGQASSLASEFHGRETDFLDVSMLRERAQLLGSLGKSNPPDDPFALERLLSETRVDPGELFNNLVGSFTLFLGLGLFESDCVSEVYMRFASGEDQPQKDTQPLVEMVRAWVSELRPSLLAELFPVFPQRGEQ